jgi:hypothetical protein
MLKLEVSPIVATRLRAAGWTPERRVDVTEAVALLTNDGFVCLPLAEKILEQFAGLKWDMIPDADILSWLEFDMKTALHWVRAKDVPYIEQLADAKVTPVAGAEGSILFVLDSDEVMLLNDQWMRYLVWEGFSEFLETVFNLNAETDWDDHDIRPEQMPPDCRVEE